MDKRIILLLSGEICVGKSTLADHLKPLFGFDLLRTRDLLEEVSKGKRATRLELQRLGEQLDSKTGGQWVVTALQRREEGRLIERGFLIIDSARIAGQVQSLRGAFGASVIHVHLRCSSERLFDRYKRKYGKQRSEATIRNEYRNIKANATEGGVPSLADSSDLVVDTDRSDARDTTIRVASFLGLLATLDKGFVDVVVGAQFGSEGKGQICAHLAPEYDALVRVGGPNAGHTVFADPPQKFHLLPSGCTRSPKSKLIIGPGAVLRLDVLTEEIRRYGITTDRLLIDENATIITVEDIKSEEILVREIGSTGQGVGFATANNILNRNTRNQNKASHFQRELKGYLGSSHEELELLYRRGRRILLEGTQGTHLSLHHGIYPYVTSRDTTVAGCLSEAGIAPRRVRKIIQVTRTYPIRVQNPHKGTSGPFGSEELKWNDISIRSGISLEELERQEKTTTTKKERRVAEFNWHLFRKSCELNSPTDIALTFVDYLSIANRRARRFELLAPETIHFIEELERCATVPVSLISTRFDYRSIIDRRPWKSII